jgi:hypothetical protein
MSSYMDKREGDILKHIAPEYFSEVYKRVQKNARDEYVRLVSRVKQLKHSIELCEKLKHKYPLQPYEKRYPKDLERAEEHLERFIAANADYLI